MSMSQQFSPHQAKFVEHLKIPHKFNNGRQVKQVRCNVCLTVQAPSKYCTNCKNGFGTYFCKKCVLYDSDPNKRHFHCDGCGVCKTGGRSNFFHCGPCQACVSIEQKHLHNHKIEVPKECPMCD